MRTSEQRSEAARSAANARWARTPVDDRAELGSHAAQARWNVVLTDEQRQAAAEARADRAAARSMPCPYCGDPVGRAGRVKCPKSECHLAHKAASMATKRTLDPAYGRTGYNEATAERYHRRRALKKGATVERFSHLQVFERDNWTCGICSEPVDREASWPDPLSVSLDHIVPLALGGDHSRTNTQCAHLGCNVRKGAQAAA